MTRWTRPFAALALAALFTVGVPPAPVAAQEAPAAGGEEASGRPLDGYIGTAILAFLALFIIAKSARR